MGLYLRFIEFILLFKIHTLKSNPHIIRCMYIILSNLGSDDSTKKNIDNDIRLSETIQKPHDISTSTLCSIDIFFI